MLPALPLVPAAPDAPASPTPAAPEVPALPVPAPVESDGPGVHAANKAAAKPHPARKTRDLVMFDPDSQTERA